MTGLFGGASKEKAEEIKEELNYMMDMPLTESEIKTIISMRQSNVLSCHGVDNDLSMQMTQLCLDAQQTLANLVEARENPKGKKKPGTAKKAATKKVASNK